MNRFALETYPLEGKKVFLRCDFNVPVKDGRVSDDTRIRAALPTITFLLNKNCTLIIGSHRGRPKGKIVEELRMKIIVEALQSLLPKRNIIYVNDCIGEKVQLAVEKAKPGSIIILENLRFYKEEKDNDETFAHSLASLADVFVNDAFGSMHRQHASITRMTRCLPSIAGFLVEKELFYLSKAIHPAKPAIWIMGGAKLEKMHFIKHALTHATYVLIGGALLFSFLKAKRIQVGMSKIDSESVKVAKEILDSKQADKIVLPRDVQVGSSFSLHEKASSVSVNSIGTDQIGLDIGPESITLFKKYLRSAKTVIWNGPLGYYENKAFAHATKEIAKCIQSLTATSIVGGGETADALRTLNLTHDITYISTGGGATLQFLEGKALPGMRALEESYRQFRNQA
ncbi:TPA: phosphoglycerate kinase [Candidatus Woesearchaeota archaeon]|nr:phosphoglycerate kinase [Candidatus Woesearchaeota archaeon]